MPSDNPPFYILDDISYDSVLFNLHRGRPAHFASDIAFGHGSAKQRPRNLLKMGKIVRVVNGIEKRVLRKSDAMRNAACCEKVDVDVGRLQCDEYTEALKKIVARQITFHQPLVMSIKYGPGRWSMEHAPSFHAFCCLVDTLAVVAV